MALQKYRADKAGEACANGAIPWFANWMGGPTLALIRNCPIEGTDIAPRTVYVKGEPDTWFSSPAACKYRDRTVRGFITMREDAGYVFVPHSDEDLPGHPAKVGE